LLKRPGKMHLFKSREPNLVHYATAVTFSRVPVFRSDHACSLFIDALATTRKKEPFKLIGYVLMPDHMNPVRAGLCDHPAKWRWSSYNAYLPHDAGSVPIEVDKRWLWTEEELSVAQGGRTSPLSKRKINKKRTEEELSVAQGGRTSPLSKRKINKKSDGRTNPLPKRKK